ncbi:MAG: hypothetical protein JWR69_4278 [Pedosphaera sp.]|nr:hypothetical protein [Pedosphaera sp.]
MISRSAGNVSMRIKILYIQGAIRVGWLILMGLFVLALVLLAMPIHKSSLRPASNYCINNLRQIDGAKQTWALETKAPSNAIPTWENVKPYLGHGKEGVLPKCPQGGVYTLGSVTNTPTCSIKGHVLE